LPIVEFVFIGINLYAFRFLSYYPNRIAANKPVFLSNISPIFFLVLEISVLVAIFINGFVTKSNLVKIFNLLFCFAFVNLLIYISAEYAQKVYIENHIARVSLSFGFWLSEFFIYLILLDSLKNMNGFWKNLVISVFFVTIFIFLFSGFLNNIDIVREYYERKNQFARELYMHIWLSLGSVVAALLLALPLGLLAYRKRRISEKIFAVLNVIQTIPSIAMFGILMVPLSYLSSRSQFLARLGVAGIGYAPAIIALVLYAMLPITRNIYTGLKNVPSHLRQASIGMGMNNNQLLFRVEIPLGITEILTGIRISLIQTIGNTALAALIGAGGLGVFIFQGLGESSNSLILLGVLPLIVMAIVADILMQIIISLFAGKSYDKTG